MRAIFIAGILLVSLELTVLMGVIMSFIPKDQSAMMADVFPRDINSLKPDWKMFIYHLVIALAILAAFAVLTRFKRFIFQKEMQRKWTLFIYCCVFFLAIEIFSFNFNLL